MILLSYCSAHDVPQGVTLKSRCAGAGAPSLDNASGLATVLNLKVEPNSDDAVVQILCILRGGKQAC